MKNGSTDRTFKNCLCVCVCGGGGGGGGGSSRSYGGSRSGSGIWYSGSCTTAVGTLLTRLLAISRHPSRIDSTFSPHCPVVTLLVGLPV